MSAAESLGRQIESQFSGYQRLPVELARVQVPGVYIGLLDAGEATLFDALLDEDVPNNP